MPQSQLVAGRRCSSVLWPTHHATQQLLPPVVSHHITCCNPFQRLYAPSKSAFHEECFSAHVGVMDVMVLVAEYGCPSAHYHSTPCPPHKPICEFAWSEHHHLYRNFSCADDARVTIGITKQVTLKDMDSSVEYGRASMINGKIHISTVKEVLAADNLSLKLVEGHIPEVDKDGWSVHLLPEDSDVVRVTTVPKPGGDPI